jgi:hypothetical protein
MSIEDIIKHGEDFAYSNDDISRLLDGKVNIYRYRDLAKFCSANGTLDDILFPFNCACILYESKEKYGHWTCLIKYPPPPQKEVEESTGGHEYEIFDSYGILPDNELNYIDNTFKIKSGQNIPFLSLITINTLKRGPKDNVYYNKVQLQSRPEESSTGGINTCGRWVGIRCFLNNLRLDEFVKLFVSEHSSRTSPVHRMTPDEYVTLLTLINR